LTPTAVVGTVPTDTDTGLALFSVYETATNFPLDIIQQNIALVEGLKMTALVVHTVTGSTGSALYGPSNALATGPSLQALTPLYYAYYTSVTANLTQTAYMYEGLSYVQINSATWPTGDIRGQLFPTMAGRRREVPSALVVSIGTWSGYLSALFRQNQVGNDHSSSAYVTLNPTDAGTFSGEFSFIMPIAKSNQKEIRQISLKMHARSPTGSTWSMALYNFTKGGYDPIVATFSTATWISAFLDSLDTHAQDYVEYPYGTVRIQVTATAATGPLYLDQFTVQPWVPSAQSNAFIRSAFKNAIATFNF